LRSTTTASVVPPKELPKLNAAQFGAEHGDLVCPANGEPGADTLKPGLDLVGKI
jgi:NADH-dependent peroxiredoxin subunit C